jgi:hypothetical protein
MKAMAWMRPSGALLLLALLAGCGGGAPERKPEPVNLSGYSPSFKQGYAEGCESARARGQRRDESRYKTEADYMMGWNDGYSVCRRGR